MNRLQRLWDDLTNKVSDTWDDIRSDIIKRYWLEVVAIALVVTVLFVFFMEGTGQDEALRAWLNKPLDRATLGDLCALLLLLGLMFHRHK